MPTVRIAQCNSIPDASWFLCRKARDLQEHFWGAPSTMLFVAQGAGGIRTMGTHLIKQKIPYRKHPNRDQKAAVAAEIADLGPAVNVQGVSISRRAVTKYRIAPGIQSSRERHSTGAILAAIKAEPHPTKEDVDELERLIEAGHRPLAPLNPFAESSDVADRDD